MKTVNEKINSLLENVKSAKDIYEQIFFFQHNNEIGEALIDLIEKNANDFTKEIANKFNQNSKQELTSKQSWCLAFQIFNNIEVYKIANIEYTKECIEITENVIEEENTEIFILKDDNLEKTLNIENEFIFDDEIENSEIMKFSSWEKASEYCEKNNVEYYISTI